MRASWIGTAVFGVTAVLGSVVDVLAPVALVVALALFLGGVVAFGVGFARAVVRSRTDDIGTMAMFFLEGEVAPAAVRRLLLASFTVEVVVAAGTAAVRPNTSLAFGILAPVYGLALAGLWGARYGRFRPRGTAATPSASGSQPKAGGDPPPRAGRTGGSAAQ